MDQTIFIPIGAGLAIGLAAIGTGYAQARIGAAGAGAVAEKPETIGSIILLLAIPETTVILGFAVAAMMLLLGGGMSLALLLEAIATDARQEIKRILDEAEAEAAAILAEAAETAVVHHQQAYQAALAPLSEQLSRRQQQATIALHTQKVANVALWVDNCLHQAEQLCKPQRPTPAYATLCRRLLEEAITALPKPDSGSWGYVICEPDDQQLVSGWLTELEAPLAVKTAPLDGGGVIVSTMDGRTQITNTLESRWQAALPFLRIELMQRGLNEQL